MLETSNKPKWLHNDKCELFTLTNMEHSMNLSAWCLIKETVSGDVSPPFCKGIYEKYSQRLRGHDFDYTFDLSNRISWLFFTNYRRLNNTEVWVLGVNMQVKLGESLKFVSEAKIKNIFFRTALLGLKGKTILHVCFILDEKTEF